MKLQVQAKDRFISAYGNMSNVVRLLTSADQRHLDAMFVSGTGISLSVLMEQAGTFVAFEVLGILSGQSDKTVVCLAGSGQNGGDVWVTARQLFAEGIDVTVCDLTFGGPLPPEASDNREACCRLGLRQVSDVADLPKQPAVLVDGIFGSGFRAGRGLPEKLIPYFDYVRALSAQKTTVVAVDLSSGVDATDGVFADKAVCSDLAVSFARPKLGQVTWPGAGQHDRIVSPALSMPAGWIEAMLGSCGVFALTDETVAALPYAIEKDAHKGSRGRALFIGGHADMPGAAILAARAMTAAGSGYQTVIVPEMIRPLVADALPHALLPLRGTGGLGRFLSGQDAVAFGPGIGRDQEQMDDLIDVLDFPGKLLLDADGLWLLSQLPDWKARLAARAVPAVLTPHAGEFLRLTGREKIFDRVAEARELAVESGSIIVLKGPATIIAFPDENALVATTGNAGLAKGGSGDVLTGLITGFLSSSFTLAEAVAAGVHLHGLSADLAAAKKGERTVMPEDVINYLPQSYFQVGWSA